MNQGTKRFWMLALAIFLGCVQVLPITVALAAEGKIYHVKMDGDDDGTSGLTWSDSFATLQKALESAVSGDQIWIAKGTYYPTKEIDPADPRTKTFQMKKGVAIYGGFPADAEDGSTERDWVKNETILSGDLGIQQDTSDNAYHVFYHYQLNLDKNSLLDGVTITGGNANGTGNHQIGGGMYNRVSHPKLHNVTIRGNTATTGGGMANDYSNPVLESVTIRDNRSTESAGGIDNNFSSPLLTDVLILDNTAAEYAGGIQNSGGEPKLTNVEISGNKAIAYDGGGIYNWNSNPVLSNVTIRRNKAKSGGGMANLQLSRPVLNHVTISENEATQNTGGGIDNNNSHPVLTHVTVQANKAGTTGGGIQNFKSSPVLTNVLMVSNQAKSGGGGMHSSNDSRPVLTNVTISGNNSTSGYGGLGHSNSSTTSLRNSIVWGNSKTNANIQELEIGNSLVNSPDPKFLLVQQGNYRLQSDSPAIGAGSSEYYERNQTPDLSGIITDMDGNPRLIGEEMDMGAYEFQDKAGLTSLAIMGNQTALAIEPAFSSSVVNYKTILSSGITELMFAPTLKDPTSVGKWRINDGGWSPVVSGSQHEVQISSGENKIEIQIEAGHGESKTYTVTLLRIPKPNFTLSHTDWINQDVTVTLSGESEMMLEYSLDGQQWVAYVGPFKIVEENQTKIYARQTDAFQNVSEIAEAEVRIDKTAPVITLNGDAVLSIHRGSAFSDPGAQVTDNLDPNPQISVTGLVDTNRLGEYTLTYEAVDHAGNQAVPVIRTVKVVREDALLKPTILLDPSGWTKGDVEVTVSGESGTKLEYSLDGQQWVAYVGPFTIRDENQTKLYARQTDALQNVSEVAEAEIHIDRRAPVITLNWASTMSIYRGSVFQDPGVRITDNIATGLTPVVTGTVDTNKLGTYTLQYDAADWAGNQAAPVTRTIRVISRPVTPPPPVEVPVPVTKVTLTPQTLTLTVGEESATLQATITPSNATNRAVSWSSSNPSVAAVDATGKVTAKQAGQATITVTTADGNKTASSEVTVVDEENEKLQLEVSLSDIHLKPGASKSFKVYAVEGEERTEITKNKDTIYDIDNDLISVKRGRITAGKKAGKAQITVRYSGAETTITVTVKKEEADRLTLKASDSLLLIEPNLTVSFRVYAVGPNTLENITHDKNTTYSIDSDLAKVTAGRVKTGKEEGETELTIHYLGEELTIPVVISKISVKSLTASTQKLLLEMDEEKTLSIRAKMSNKREKDVTELVDWSSSTSGIVEVAEDGTIIPLKKGTAVLTARYGGRNVNISVRVVDEKELQELHATYSSLSLEEGETASLAITAIYERNHKEDVTEEVEWSVDDPEIATVENGVITGISEGVTTITATYAGKEVEISIKVQK
ncbi:hypothetical protein T458_07720 [Brevibacillus panacihumi W25]|uniref:BIG2 domain-containing protein n=1 Tax=Brevibacillus panacihumi W25 TaxID=1408254 RepID=V6MAR4_9BACL|nr:immunoglobulin-like domain-containing protein [Brevibacillus panacihumi]EST55604.1 hypothetical protein T458_07720 [Brevibacillus panacihumi W25]